MNGRCIRDVYFDESEVYYSSKTWGFVGCALCGFGAYPLMVSCEPGAGGAGSFDFHMRGAAVFKHIVMSWNTTNMI